MQKLKTKLPALSLYFLLIILMAGCKKNEVISASKMSDKEIIATYGKLGEFHNKALDYIYKEL